MASDAEATLAACRRERESMLASLSMLPALVRADSLAASAPRPPQGNATIGVKRPRPRSAEAVAPPLWTCLPDPVGTFSPVPLPPSPPRLLGGTVAMAPPTVLPLRNFVRRRTGGGGEKASDVHAAGGPERRSSLKTSWRKMASTVRRRAPRPHPRHRPP